MEKSVIEMDAWGVTTMNEKRREQNAIKNEWKQGNSQRDRKFAV